MRENIERIARMLQEQCREDNKISEKVIKTALRENRVTWKDAEADLMDALETLGIEIIQEEIQPISIYDPDDESSMQELNSLTLFLNDIGRFKLLTPEEERHYFTILNDNSRPAAERKNAKDMLVNCNMRLVFSIAKRYMHSENILDLVNVGAIGLMTAIDRFDINRGVKLSTYAVWWIKQSCVRHIADNGIVRIPVYMKDLAKDIHKYILSYKEENDVTPTDETIANHFNIGVETVKAFTTFETGVESIDKPLKNTEDDEKLMVCDVIEGDEDVERDVIQTFCRDEILDVLNEVLSEKEAKVISLRYGLITKHNERLTLLEIGNRMNLTRERIRQIENKAMKKLHESDVVFEKLHPWLEAA